MGLWKAIFADCANYLSMVYVVCLNFVYVRYHASLYISKCRKDAPATPPKYNELDGNVNRKSYEGFYQLIDGVPR